MLREYASSAFLSWKSRNNLVKKKTAQSYFVKSDMNQSAF